MPSLPLARSEWLQAVCTEDRASVEKVWTQAAHGGSFDVEYRIVRPDGTQRWIWDRGYAVRDARGSVQGIAGIADDVTVLKQAQAQVLQSERLVAIGEAMTGLAHESRNALQRSQACLEMLAKRVTDRPEAQDLIERIVEAQRHLHALYEQVRGYAAPIRLTKGRCQLDRVLEDVWDRLAEVATARGAVLNQDVNDVPLECDVDRLRIEQLFRNILENALAAGCEVGGSESPRRIDAAWREASLADHAAIEVTISDNGPGFAPGQAERVFDPFYTTKARGTGLGMAIARRIVEAHGGHIRVGRTDGPGAAIVVTLPRSVP